MARDGRVAALGYWTDNCDSYGTVAFATALKEHELLWSPLNGWTDLGMTPAGMAAQVAGFSENGPALFNFEGATTAPALATTAGLQVLPPAPGLPTLVSDAGAISITVFTQPNTIWRWTPTGGYAQLSMGSSFRGSAFLDGAGTAYYAVDGPREQGAFAADEYLGIETLAGARSIITQAVATDGTTPIPAPIVEVHGADASGHVVGRLYSGSFTGNSQPFVYTPGSASVRALDAYGGTAGYPVAANASGILGGVVFVNGQWLPARWLLTPLAPPPPGTTATGSSVIVTPVDATTAGTPATLTFATVTTAGITSLTTSSHGPPPPSGFKLGAPPVYYNLSTTATFSGTVQVCINFGGRTFTNPANLKLWHFRSDGTWENITTALSLSTSTVCGQSTSLSPFFVSEPLDPLTITASSGVKTYGQQLAVTPAFNGFVNGDTSAVLSAQPTCTSNGSVTSAAASGSPYATSCTGATADNYLISYVAGTITVNRAPLTVTANNQQKAWDGSPLPANAYSATIAGFTNGESVAVVSGSSGFAGPAVTATSPGNYAITPTAGSLSATNYQFTSFVSGTLTIVDATPPVVSSLALTPDPVALGTTASLAATITDVGYGGSSITTAQYSTTGGVSWTSVGSFTPAPTVSVGASATLATGVYNLCVRGTDVAGNTSNTACALLAVYDPSAGFVTGGGWINSPAGAYAADPTLTGKATFGFVAKYVKGQTAPTGDTEFQFSTADFTFKSTSYDWLVVAGAKAQYKGSGIINGGGNYGFLLTAVDGQLNGGGGVDKFRIKIWDKSTGAVLYDNQIGATDDSALTTALGGGNIVIHQN